jgi:hypothetical protein
MVLGGATIFTLAGESCACAMPLTDTTTIITNVVSKNKLLFIYVSLFAEIVCEGPGRCRPSRIEIMGMPGAFEQPASLMCSMPFSSLRPKSSCHAF